MSRIEHNCDFLRYFALLPILQKLQFMVILMNNFRNFREIHSSR